MPASPENTNSVIVAFMRACADEVSGELQIAFVKEYPRAKANTLDASTIEEWTRNTVAQLTEALETNDASAFLYTNSYGIIMEDPREPVLSMFSSCLATLLFMARHIAPLAIGYYRTDGRLATKAIDQLEAFVQRAIEENCRAFADDACQKHALSRGWLQNGTGRAPAIASDSPASRYMDKTHYARIVDSLMKPAEPQGDALTRREQEVLAQMMKGLSNADIAAALEISESTVKKHVSHIFDKYNVFSRGELFAKLAHEPKR